MHPSEEAEAAHGATAPVAVEAEAAEELQETEPLPEPLQSLMSLAFDAARRAMSSLAVGPPTIWMATS